MKDLLKKPVTFEKVEFWAATAIYVFAVFILLGEFVNRGDYKVYTRYTYLFDRNNMPYSYVKFYFLPELCRYTVYYLSYVFLTFFVLRAFVKGERLALNIFFLICIYAVAATLLSTTDTWIKSYLFYGKTERYVYHLIFKQDFAYTLWILLMFAFYNIGKAIFSTVTANFEDTFTKYNQVTKECIIAVGLWTLGIFFLLISRAQWEIYFVWSEIILYAIFMYWYSFHNLLPKVTAEGGELGAYLAKVLIVLLISFFPVAFLMFGIFHRMEAPVVVNLVNVGVGLFMVAPFSWFLYQYRLKKNVELHGLKTALGSSNANLDFLRSQINPHFLFNALNTLYGTSLQENAERTGEGIQKLGDMMRFMLQENMQEKISLAREVDYLNNYIDLQKLRTQTSPDILIWTEIEEQVNALQIAPMLLIPFVENAFKHGISLRETSHIKISLQTRGNELLFDVYNSIHDKSLNDPEQNKSGIGLENVKQRLQLLYPNRHELTIRDSAKEFFIHLSVTL